MHEVGENNGENLNNVVTAIGTAGVAPIFIVNNPLAKEDKKTKVATITTTLPNGTGSLTVKEAGTYYLKEVSAPTGYILKSGFIEVTLNEAVNVVEKTIYNEKDRDYVINIIKKAREALK